MSLNDAIGRNISHLVSLSLCQIAGVTRMKHGLKTKSWYFDEDDSEEMYTVQIAYNKRSFYIIQNNEEYEMDRQYLEQFTHFVDTHCNRKTTLKGMKGPNGFVFK
jgi:hypothetical protein